ncbi:MAG: hypothetical protein GKR77_07650 [Legionellales bacterium]|nr:hypothetical protein [Legionellales bacterium]
MSNLTLLERINCLPQTDDKTDPHVLRARRNHARSYMVWDEAEDQILLCLIEEDNSLEHISRQLKRSHGAIDARLKILGACAKVTKKSEDNDENFALSTHHDQHRLNTVDKNEVRQVLRYWRNSLADADKMGLPPEKIKQGEEFTLREFKSGHLDFGKIKHFFDEAEKEIKKKNKYRKKYQNRHSKAQEDEVVVKKLAVLIAPYVLVKNHEHGKRSGGERSPRELFPLWLVADITRDGELIPSEESTYPWIERKCLTPNESNSESIGFPIIGDVEQVDEFYTRNVDLFPGGKQTWEALFSYAQNLFLSVIDNGSDVFIEQNFSLLEKGYVLPVKDIIEVSKSLISTYDQHIYESDENIPKILNHFCALKDDKCIEDLSKEELFIASAKHLAQAQRQYPLAESQRISLSYFNAVEDNRIFPIHGPPGTGKTTLLLSVIVSQWVESAIQNQYPPLLVAASTNNLAVLNVLDHFKKVGHADLDKQSIRWLPDFDGYGLYTHSTCSCEF